MNAIKTAAALSCGAAVLVGSLVSCAGGSDGVQAGASPSASATTTSASPSPTKATKPVWVSLTADQAATAAHRLGGDPGVDHTSYAAASETFYVYFTADVTPDDRRHVRRVIYSVLGS